MSSSHVAQLGGLLPPTRYSAEWSDQLDGVPGYLSLLDVIKWLRKAKKLTKSSTVTSSIDVWVTEPSDSSTNMDQRLLLLSKLAWTPEEILETRARLSTFEQDWDAPGMEIYDEL